MWSLAAMVGLPLARTMPELVLIGTIESEETFLKTYVNPPI